MFLCFKTCIFISFQSGQRLLNVEGHKKAVNDIQPYHDTTMFVTASKDTTAKVCFIAANTCFFNLSLATKTSCLE